MLSHHKAQLAGIADPVARVLLRAHVRPNQLTMLGLGVSVLAAWALAEAWFRLGAALLSLAGILDLLDGSLARVAGQETDFGAFLDSVVDRHSDLVVLIGVTVLYQRAGDRLGVVLTMATLVGTVMVSYTKARAQSIGVGEGFERRPPHQLSGGEKKRVAIAGVHAMDPDVLILDEPTSGLDPSGSEDIMELLDELNLQGKTIIISTRDIELAYPWADRAILLLGGKILQEDIPDVAFGRPEYVRKAHLSMPTLLELYFELQNRGFSLPERKPRTVLDMLNVIDRAFHNRPCHTEPGSITVCDIDSTGMDSIRALLSDYPELSIGAMGTRAKQQAMDHQINLDFTYGVIDKCILKALLGEISAILTTGSMVQRVFDRVNDFSRENGVCIPVSFFNTDSEKQDN